jgi:hypothetical protein
MRWQRAGQSAGVPALMFLRISSCLASALDCGQRPGNSTGCCSGQGCAPCVDCGWPWQQPAVAAGNNTTHAAARQRFMLWEWQAGVLRLPHLALGCLLCDSGSCQHLLLQGGQQALRSLHPARRPRRHAGSAAQAARNPGWRPKPAWPAVSLPSRGGGHTWRQGGLDHGCHQAGMHLTMWPDQLLAMPRPQASHLG